MGGKRTILANKAGYARDLMSIKKLLSALFLSLLTLCLFQALQKKASSHYADLEEKKMKEINEEKLAIFRHFSNGSEIQDGNCPLSTTNSPEYR